MTTTQRTIYVKVGVLGLVFVESLAIAQDVDRVHSSWLERSESVKTFRYTVGHQCIEMVNTDPPDDPTDPFGPLQKSGREPIELEGKFTFTVKGTKMMVVSRGEKWHHQKCARIRQTFQHVFDGSSTKTLLSGEGVLLPMGNILSASNPAPELTINTRYVPLLLSFFPAETLTRRNYVLREMEIRDRRAFHEGEACIELSVPRKEGRQPVQVFVTRSNGHLIRRMVEWHNPNMMRSDTSIEYKMHKPFGWITTGWTSHLYDDVGVFKTSVARSTDFTINEPVDDDVFDISYPIGTHIREAADGEARFFIQQPDGTRKQIPKGEYGAISPSTLSDADRGAS